MDKLGYNPEFLHSNRPLFNVYATLVPDSYTPVMIDIETEKEQKGKGKTHQISVQDNQFVIQMLTENLACHYL